jgi:transposase-like protein
MNLIDVSKKFSTEDACYDYLEKMRWPVGITCLKCGSVKVSRFTSKGKTKKVRRLYQCLEKECHHQFTATTGTIFHDTHLPLQKWFLALALICESKKGMSANQLKRALGVQYRTAWYLCHRIRKAMTQEGEEKMRGKVEVDETYIGGKYDRRRSRQRWDKIPVIGVIQRGGRVHAEVLPGVDRAALVGVIKEQVAPDAEVVITDEHTGYKKVKRTHRHATVNHIKGEYVRGNIHTNSIENFWSLLKRGIIGSFHKVSEKHLARYLAEFTYRFNNREVHDLFSQTLARLLDKINMPYRELTASDGASA